jgi:hypothetical protein
MCDYRLDFKGIITLEDYSSIYDYMELVSSNDNLTITIDEQNEFEVEMFKSMVKNKKFSIYERIKNDDNSCSITVGKSN